MNPKRTVAAFVVALGLLASPGATLAYDSGPEYRHSHAPQAVQTLQHGPGGNLPEASAVQKVREAAAQMAQQ
jgi:hypothetical protein